MAGFHRSEASDELKVPSSDKHTLPSAYLQVNSRVCKRPRSSLVHQ